MAFNQDETCSSKQIVQDGKELVTIILTNMKLLKHAITDLHSKLDRVQNECRPNPSNLSNKYRITKMALESCQTSLDAIADVERRQRQINLFQLRVDPTNEYYEGTKRIQTSVSSNVFQILPKIHEALEFLRDTFLILYNRVANYSTEKIILYDRFLLTSLQELPDEIQTTVDLCKGHLRLVRLFPPVTFPKGNMFDSDIDEVD